MGSIKRMADKVIYGNDLELINHPNRKTQDKLSLEAVFGGMGLTLIGGTFRTRFMLKIGAGLNDISILASLVGMAVFACIFGSFIFDGRKKSKNLILSILLVSRIAEATVFFIPFLPGFYYGNGTYVYLAITAIVLSTMAGQMADVGYNKMLSALIAPNMRGRVIAVRNTINYIFTPLIPLAAAYFVDKRNGSFFAYYVLASLAILFYIGNNYSYNGKRT